MAAPVVRILDGGMGDILSERVGRKLHSDWSASCLLDARHHEMVVDLHREYLAAGSTLITTCNFSLRRDHGFTDDVIQTGCRTAAELAHRAVKSTGTPTTAVQVLGSLPPLGQCFLNQPVVHPVDQYACMIRGLQEGGCRTFLAETMSSVQEALLVRDALSKYHTSSTGASSLSWMVSFAVTSTGTLYSGETVDDAVRALLTSSPSSSPLVAILLNCSPPEYIQRGLESLSPATRALLQAQRCELGVYANRYPATTTASIDVMQHVEHRVGLTPADFAAFALHAVREHGVSIVGGCCGVTPPFIAHLAKAAAADNA